jgi:hypothetical protein
VSRRSLIVLAAGALIALGIGIWLIADGSGDDSGSCGPFTPDAWRRGASNLNLEPKREDQARSLISCGLLTGKTPHQVRSLLGEAPQKSQGYWDWPIAIGFLGDETDLTVHFVRSRVAGVSIDRT